MDYRQNNGNIKCYRSAKEALHLQLNTLKKSPEGQLVWRSITHKDNIDVNYYMEMSDSVFEHDAYLEFKIGGQTYKQCSDAAEVNENGKTLYRVHVGECSWMSDTIETRIVIDNKTEEEYSYSVKEYPRISKSNRYPEETIKLVKALLNYGTAAPDLL